MMVVGMLKVQNAILYFLRAKAFCSFSYFIHLKGGDGTKKGSFITKMLLYSVYQCDCDIYYDEQLWKKFFVQRSLAKSFVAKQIYIKFPESNNHNFYLYFYFENCGFATGQLCIGVLNGVVDAVIHVFHLRKQRCGIRHGIVIPSFHLQNK